MIFDATESDLVDVVHMFMDAVNEMDVVIHKPEYKAILASVAGAHVEIPCKVVRENDKIIGFASLYYSGCAWSSKRLLTSNMVYVLPEHRSFAILKELYKEIRRTAKLQGVPYVDNFTCSDKIDARARLSKAQNLKVIGVNIMYKDC